MSLSIGDFAKTEMRVAKVLSVEDIPQARKPMFKIVVDLGEGSTKQCVAGIKTHYSKESLVGKFVIAVVNLQPKDVAGVTSECMLLAAYDEKELALLVPDKQLPPGTKVG